MIIRIVRLTQCFEYDRSAAESSAGFERCHSHLVLRIRHQVTECHGIGVDRYLRHYPVTDKRRKHQTRIHKSLYIFNGRSRRAIGRP